MRVLHVHRIAHIPQLLVRELEKNGIEAEFVEGVGTSEKIVTGSPGASSTIVANIRDYDIIHGHYALNRHTIQAFRQARKNGIPFILHCHGSDLRLLTGTSRVDLPLHYRTVSQYIRKRASGILLSTPDLIEFEPRGFYIPNPVDLDMFRPMPGVEKSDRHLILGRQIRNSGILNHIRPDIQYDCVNDGESIPWPENVRLLEHVAYEKLPEFFNHYDHMLGTFGDLISMARLEAMACGLRTFTDFDSAFSKYYNGQSPDNAPDPRQFIQRFHAPNIAIEKLTGIYDGIVSVEHLAVRSCEYAHYQHQQDIGQSGNYCNIEIADLSADNPVHQQGDTCHCQPCQDRPPQMLSHGVFFLSYAPVVQNEEDCLADHQGKCSTHKPCIQNQNVCHDCKNACCDPDIYGDLPLGISAPQCGFH